MENLLGPAFATGIKQGKLVAALDPKTRLQMVAVEDIGKLGKMAFIRHAELLGRKVEFQRQPIAEVRAFSEDFAIMLEWFDRVGYDADIPGLKRTYGIELTRFRRWAEAHRQAWA